MCSRVIFGGMAMNINVNFMELNSGRFYSYYGGEEATKKAIDESGWLHSGDLGVMDEDSYVRITGRLKDMIIRGVENIYPREIEDVLYTHLKATEAEMKTFCKGELAHFKVPKYISFVEQFPMTVTGKLQKFRMRKLAMEKKGIRNKS
ncbi:MAG: AMP-binding protein [bacterium]|nr:AMP-binding protein [bacterium]